MDLVTWIIFAAIALFFDVAAGWWKRQRQKNAEFERRAAREEYEIAAEDELGFPYEEVYRTDSTSRQHEYSIQSSEDARYLEGADALESAAPLDIQTYDEEAGRPVGRRVSVQEIAGYEVVSPEEQKRRKQESRKQESHKQGPYKQEPPKVIVHPPVVGKPAIASRTQLRVTEPAALRRSTSRTLILNPRTARDAIIWMEVLGPPKGMRI